MGGSWMRRALPGALMFSLAMSWTLPAWSQVEEIVVTVRKKGESLQDVPMAVSAMGAEDIQRKGIKDITDIAKFSTSLQFDESFAQSDTRIAVRGLSPTRGRQNVALLVDGVDVSSEAITSSGGSLLLNTRLVDVERIEVVLGPQMALYGRSAFNGAIQYITKDAAEEFEADLRIDAGYSSQFEARQYEAIGGISGPILGDALGYRLNGTWWDDEGFYKNEITNQRIGGGSGVGAALTLTSDLGDRFSMKFRAEYTDDDSQPSPQVFLPFNTELNAPQGAFDAGVAECAPDFIALLATVPGNNQAFLDRGRRLMDPSFFADIEAGLNPNYAPGSLDPNSPNFVIPAGGGPHCEDRTPARVGDVPDRDALLAQRGVTLAPNPVTPGVDYAGFDREMFRLSFVAAYEADDWTVKSLTGFTRDDNSEQQDTNVYAFLSPEAGAFLDGNVNSFAFDNDKITKQFSQDIVLTTNFDGPVNGMLGGLWWQEKVANSANSITSQASGSHCFWNSISGEPFLIEDGCTGFTSTPYAPYQAAGSPFRTTSPVDRDTDHYSIYGGLDFEFAENWTLAFEGRYNHEEIDVAGPLFLDPSASGGPGGLNPCGIFFRPCEPFDDWRANGNWFTDAFFPWTDEAPDGTDLNAWVPDQAMLDAIPGIGSADASCKQQNQTGIASSIADGPVYIEREADGITPVWKDGEVVPILDANGLAQGVDKDGNPVSFESGQAVGTDTFNPWCVGQLSNTDEWFSPKIRLEWAASDDMLFYVAWSRARKPGGFGLLSVGSSGLDRELSEFEAEKMEVWEFGGNTTWVENTIVLNGSIFFQDFTDKQALTSRLNETTGRLISKIENAGSAEVWGTELSLSWSPIAEFLGGNWQTTLGGTWLPTREYTDFVIQSTSATTASHAGNCTAIGGICDISYTGNKLENSAALAVNGFVQYMISLSASVSTYVETDIFWQSSRYTGITNQLKTADYMEMNLRWGFQGEQWDAVLYVDNLIDNDAVRSVGGGPGLGCCFVLGDGVDVSDADPTVPSAAVQVDLPLYNTAFLPDPRTIGVRMSYHFGGGG
jgi:outer membrane receptor protein involved in Fe transport